MINSEGLAAVKLVKQEAEKLTLACAEVVGPLPMMLAMPTVDTIGLPIPRRWWRRTRKLDKRG